MEPLASCLALSLFLELMKWMSLLAELQSDRKTRLAASVLAASDLGSSSNFSLRPACRLQILSTASAASLRLLVAAVTG